MKKLIPIILIISLASCLQIPEFEFSCNPEINDYVLKNQSVLSKASLSDFSSYDIQLQRAIFRSFTGEKKKDVWIQKLQSLLDSNDFSESEIVHIKRLMDFINQGLFQLQSLKDGISNEQFALDWISFAKDKLGWSDYFIAFVAYRLYTNYNQFDSELSSVEFMRKTTLADAETEGCNCSTTHDYCWGSDCISNGCTISSGCGFIWSETCDGICNF